MSISDEDVLDILFGLCDCLFHDIKEDSELYAVTDSTKEYLEDRKQNIIQLTLPMGVGIKVELTYHVEKSLNQYIQQSINDKVNPINNYSEININKYFEKINEYCKVWTEAAANKTYYFQDFLNVLKDIIIQKFQSVHHIFMIINNSYDDEESTFRQKIKDINKTYTQDIGRLLSNTKKKLTIVENKIASLERKIYENSITILGIFSAAVLAFNAATGFYSSILEAFSSASTYKVLLIILIIGIILVGVMMGLFHYLETIRTDCSDLFEVFKKQEKDNSSKDDEPYTQENATKVTQDNVAQGGEKQNVNKHAHNNLNALRPMAPFLITLAVLIGFLVILISSWYNGCIESRNADINKKYSISASSNLIEEDINESINIPGSGL